jgi:predicted CxxxxCH...CXXCH cytochrome family protein
MATDATGSGSHRIHTIATGANFDCGVCHAGYTKTTSVPATHVNGLINLNGAFTYSQGAAHAPATGYGSCSVSACHGQGTVTWGAVYVAPGNTFPYSTSQCDKCHAGTATAPFYSTAIPKVTAATDAKVGAHTSHLTAPDSIATALTCAACHGAVTTVNAANHMNGATSFVWSTLAQTGGLTPVYTAGTCTSVYCHGAAMPGGDTSGSNRAPVWNSTTYLPATLTAAACGTCHGFPPSAVSGHPVITIPAGFPATASIGTTCSCHSNINPAGNSYATIFVNKALHINGTLEVVAGGACDTCHGYPPASAGFAGTLNNWANAKSENYPGGGGAHTITNHVSKLAVPANGFADCVKCHDAADHQMSPITFNPSQNIKVRVNQRFRFEAAKQFKYSSNRLDGASHLTGTCSNASCHFGATPKWDPSH